MWLNYAKERWGYSSIEEKWGFVLYSPEGEDLFIQEFYIKPEFRGEKLGVALMHKVILKGKQLKCNRAIIQIWSSDKGATRTMACVLGYGFKIAEASNGRILLAKEIEGD